MRRAEEITTAQERVVPLVVKKPTDSGLKATGRVRHGNVADTLNDIAK